MENNKLDFKKYAFDLDGTLVDGKGELNKGVVNFFYNLLTRVNNPKITICSGNNKKSIEKAVEKINNGLKLRNLSGQRLLRPEMVTFGGAQIIEPDGNFVKSQSITPSQFRKVNEIINIIDKNAIIFGNSQKGLVYKEPKPISKKNAMIKILKTIAPFVGLGKYTFTKLDDKSFSDMIKNGEIYSLEILEPDSYTRKVIYSNLADCFRDLNFTYGTTIQAGNGSKKEAAFRDVKEEDVCYVGDGNNDIPVMRSAGLSFALGKKLKVLKSATYAVEDFDNISDVVFKGMNYTLLSELKIREIQDKVIKKYKKEEQSLSK